MRNGEVVESRHVPERERQVHGGFAVRSVEDAILGRMLVGHQRDVKGRLDRGYRSSDLNLHAIARASDDRQAMGQHVADDRVIVVLRGAKPRGELGRSQEMIVVWDGSAVQLGEKRIEAGCVAQGQYDVQLHDLVNGNSPDGPCQPVEGGLADMAGHQCLGTALHESGKDERCEGEQRYKNSPVHNSSWISYVCWGQEIARLTAQNLVEHTQGRLIEGG